MPKLNKHKIIENNKGQLVVIKTKDNTIIGLVNDILKSHNCEDICKQFVHQATQSIKLPSNYDPDWEGWATEYGYRHYVNDETQKLFAKDFYLFEETAKESFISFLKAEKLL